MEEGGRAAVKPNGPTGVKKAGGDPDAAMKELKAELAKYKAAY